MANEATNFVAGKVAESLFDVAKKEVGYMWNSKKHVENFSSEYVKLKNKRRRVEERMELATKNGDKIVDGVEEWFNKAGAHITTAEAFLKEAADAEKTFFNLRTLHHYGKEATKKVLSIEELLNDGADYEGDHVSIPTPPPGILELLPRKNIDDLDTHKSLLEKIIESVNRTQITGIWGIGGVGKTTLATEVAARVKHLFDLVVFVTVSRPIDAEKIKKDVDIAVKRIINGDKVLIILDDVWDALKLDTVGIPSCVDDHPNFKILLTSRERSVCKAMHAQEIGVDSLPIDEAWILFKRVVGEEVETDANLRQVAREIVKGCGGLPLILQAVGKALKDIKNIKEWEHARESIQKHKTSDIDEDIELEFAHLRLSYDYLKSEEAKSIFLLCCMFPEDFDIPLELLAYYGVGLELFEEPYSLEDARNKVQRAVKILKSSCLLLVGRYESTTKMHDVVRQVALLIASKGNNKFLVEAGKNLTLWEPRPGSLSYTGISLMRNDICKLPAGYKLNIPLLKIFLVQENYHLSEISDEFILAMQAVKVIDFERNVIKYLPESLNQLKKLRMLNLDKNRDLCDVSILGALEDLEILILNGTGIKEIPQEIGNLINLRLFHAAGCRHLSHIEPGVLSKLRWLEELRIGYHPAEGKDNSLVEIGNVINTGFLIDPVESPSHGSTGLTDGLIDFFAQNRLSVSRPVHGSTSRFNPSVKTLEIGELGKLTSLHLWVPHICLIPEGDYQKRLKTFCIQIGGSEEFIDDDDIRAGDKILILETLDDDISHLEHVRKWIEVCNDIVLRSINNLDKLDKIMPMVYCEGFGFKTIYIRGCANLLYLVDSLDEMQTSFFSSIGNHEGVKEHILSEVEQLRLSFLSSLKVIWNCADEYISLNNLVTLEISWCPKLEKLFSVSVSQGLVNLKELRIQWCDSLKEVISDGDGETGTSEIDLVVPPKNIVFRRLAEIELARMESLTSFYPGNATIKYPSLVKVTIWYCDKLEKWGNETHDTPKLQVVEINGTKVNGSTIDETLVKYREAEELREKQWLDKRKQWLDQRTEEGPSSVGQK